ncbi:uncharacterized protein STEHIDRAFT_157835 [Stereum hirsutum FP-91666 SS1]|uniref:uncharacterized protein n=1 Tax=Stereum hirsutum (strain FP-91666) TaxID=721885 RepID=UPI000444A1EB|nr:uncharacterized protein STEHIDRAFT_157835 [Stereum hirsutum FP-91666 SS1]EIM86333.1 hypothetical protein STEHIDRAFT_157835 [Stereum hirsutum FP-91666 SS1]
MLAPFLIALLVSALHVSFAHHPPSLLDARTLSNTAQTSGFSTFDLLSIPGPQSRTFTALPTIPSLCASYTSSSSECTATMQAFNITLGDCGSSWTMCRCTDADISLEEAVDHLARVPVGLRRNVGTVFIMKDSSAHAYTEAGDIHFFGVCSQRTWVHESTHASDHGHSSSEEWINAVDGDSCVPDSYAQSNYVEDFAQVSVLQVYQQYFGELPTPYTADCMQNQLAYMKNLSLYANDTLFGETCAFQDDWSSPVHTVAPQTTAADAVISGSYTTVTTELTITASSGAFGEVNAATVTASSSPQSTSASSTVSLDAATSTQSTSAALRQTSTTTATRSVLLFGTLLHGLTLFSLSL